MNVLKKIVLCIFIYPLFHFSGANNETSNVMKIKSGSDDGDRANSTNEVDEVNATFIPYDLQIVMDALSVLNYSECGRDTTIVMEAINRRERWALQMFDASPKFPVGLLHGTFYQFGNFDECVGLRQPNTNIKDTPIQGQYCLADVELFNKNHYEGRVARSFETFKDQHRNVFNSTMHWGICVPSSCTTEEVELLVKQIFTLATNHKTITVRLNSDKCHVNKPLPFTVLEIVYGCFIGIFCAFTILTTVFHYYVIQQKRKSFNYNVASVRECNSNRLKEAILCFSLIKSVGKFLQTKSSDLNLECIAGIKFLSMAFIIMGHTLLFLIGGPVQNTDFYDRESTNFINGLFINSPLLVDTFLLVSGFLMCYLFLIDLDKRKGKRNVLLLYIARYIRLTPSYLVVIGLYCSLLFRMGDGPLWNSRVKQEQERCLKSWWTNLLYINNYVNTENMCMFQSWYLATDYHLFIIAPLIIYPLWKWQKVGIATLGIGTLISVLIPFVITLKNKLDPTLMIYAPEVYDLTENFYFKTAYIKTHMRASSYFFGLLLGYLLYKLQTKGAKIPKYVIWFGWILSLTCGIVSMFSIIFFYFPNHEYNALESAIYASLHRAAWCISIGWIIIICVTDNATLVNRFLSWKPFIPLSRLTYCAYLINGLIEIYSFGSQREGIFMSKFELTNTLFSHCVLTLLAAFVLCIFFESPIHGLEKNLLRRERKVDAHKSNTDPVNENCT